MDFQIRNVERNAENIFTATKYLHVISKTLLLAPYSYSKTNIEFVIIPSKSKLLYIFLAIEMLLIVALDVLHQETEFVRTVQARCSIESITVCILEAFMKRKSMADTLNQLRKLENDLFDLGHIPNYRRYKMLTVSLIMFIMAKNFAIALNCLVLDNPRNWQMIIIYYFSGTVVTLHCCHFICYAIFLCGNLQFLNAYLYSYLGGSKNLTLEETNRIRVIYSKIWNAAECLNANYSIVLLLVFGHGVFNTIVASYFLLSERVLSANISKVLEECFWITSNLSRLIVTVLVCHFTKLQVIKIILSSNNDVCYFL